MRFGTIRNSIMNWKLNAMLKLLQSAFDIVPRHVSAVKSIHVDRMTKNEAKKVAYIFFSVAVSLILYLAGYLLLFFQRFSGDMTWRDGALKQD